MYLHICDVLVIVVAVVTSLTEAFPVKDEEDAVDYLKRYQYMGETSPLRQMKGLMDKDALPKALELFQRRMALDVTGIFDNATLEMMNMPRCGMPDITSTRSDMKRRRKRFAFLGTKWANNVIRYKILTYTKDLHVSTVQRLFKRAFGMWGDVTPLIFIEGDFGYVHITIRFATGYHGDNQPFDGPGNVLAHADRPMIGAEVHFDDDEDFTDSSYLGINLLYVAVHEFGHSLGLDHSDVPDAIMFPTYREYNATLHLHSDDIEGIQMLYGSKPPPTTTTTTPAVDFCLDSTVDAICQNGKGHLLVFQGNWYALVDPASGIRSGYPRPIADTFHGLPGNLDAAYYDQQFLLLFKGAQVWRYIDKDDQYVLSVGFPEFLSYFGLPNDIDMIFKWTGNGAVYVIKGDLYYKLNESSKVIEGYPRNISKWHLPDVNKPYTDAFSFGIRTFFIAGDSYYRYNDMSMEVDPDYPKTVARMWFGCYGGIMEMDLDQTHMSTVKPYDEDSGQSLSMFFGLLLVSLAANVILM